MIPQIKKICLSPRTSSQQTRHAFQLAVGLAQSYTALAFTILYVMRRTSPTQSA